MTNENWLMNHLFRISLDGKLMRGEGRVVLPADPSVQPYVPGTSAQNGRIDYEADRFRRGSELSADDQTAALKIWAQEVA